MKFRDINTSFDSFCNWGLPLFENARDMGINPHYNPSGKRDSPPVTYNPINKGYLK